MFPGFDGAGQAGNLTETLVLHHAGVTRRQPGADPATARTEARSLDLALTLPLRPFAEPWPADAYGMNCCSIIVIVPFLTVIQYGGPLTIP